MSKTNHCFIIGNLGQEPTERSRSAKAGPIVGFSVAENVQAYDEEAKEYKTVYTNWFNVTAFGNLAERAKKSLHKGERVAIQGRMKIAKFKDKAGEERSGFEIIADDIAIWKTLSSSEPGAKPSGKKGPDDSLPF